MTFNNKHILIVTCVLYVIAWLLPIELSSNMKGYEGAEIAHKELVRGLKYFVDVVIAAADVTFMDVLDSVVEIIAGSPNILFVSAAILLFLTNHHALYFAAPGLLVMLLWGGGVNPIGGYGLWVLTGLVVFVLAATNYKKQKNIPYYRLIYSRPLITTYIIGALVFLSERL